MLFLPPNQRRQSTEGKDNLMMIVRYRVNQASGVVSGQDRRERSDTQSDSSSKSDADQFYSSSSTLTPAPTSSGGAAVHGQQPALLFDILVYFWGWLGSRGVVSVLDSGAVGPGFKSQPRRCRVSVLGKLFTPIVPLFIKQRNW